MNRRAFARSLVTMPTAVAVPAPTIRAGDVGGPPPARAGEMPMARGNAAHTGEHPGPGPVGKPVVLWRFRTNAPIASSPAVWDGRVYVGSDDGFLFAVDAAEGVAVWGFDLGHRIRATPAIHDGRLFIANGAISIHDAASGRQRFQIASDRFHMSSSLVPAEAATLGWTVFGSGMRGTSGFVDARAPFDGRTRWRYDVPYHTTTIPTVSGNSVYFGTLSGELTALDAATKALRWQFQTAGGILSAPAVANGTVYVTSWAPAPGQQGAVVPNASGLLYAVDAETGLERWQAETGSPVESGPAVAGGLAIVGGGRSLFAFEAESGRPRWRFETGDAVRSSPAVAAGVVYVGSLDGNLYAVDAETGEQRWALEAGFPLDSAPAVVDGVVYVTGGDALLAIGGL
jgi:outer membrane protein assembly factor BamB